MRGISGMYGTNHGKYVSLFVIGLVSSVFYRGLQAQNQQPPVYANRLGSQDQTQSDSQDPAQQALPMGGQRSTADDNRTIPQNGPNLQGAPNLQQPQDLNRPIANQETLNRNTAASANRDVPQPPTEFQRLVQSSVGQILPIYGASLFLNAPSTFAPLDRVPVTPGYVVGPGDELLIQVWGQVTLNSRFTIDRAGNIFIPQVGTVRVAGLPFSQLQGYLQAQMAKVFRNFDLNVNMGQLRSIQIFVVGQARRPGSYTVSSLSTLVDALFVTGGPTPQGSLRHIQLKRAGGVVIEFDLYDLLQKGDKSKDAELLPGDVIYIPPVGPQIAVAGSVNTPAIYELKSAAESTVQEATDLASGPTNIAATTSVRLERIDAHARRSVSEVSLDQSGRSTLLRDGDILEFISVTDQFSNGVTLRGNVANPGHYSWKPGMRVRDLFPDKDALITRNYWLRRGNLSEPSLFYTPYCAAPATVNEGTTPAVAQGIANGSTNCIPTTTPAPRSAEDQGSLNNGQARTTSNGPGGGSRGTAAASVVPASGTFEATNTITLSAPDIDWSYAVIERQNRETLVTSLIPFNLGQLVLEGDAAQNPELQPGDVVTIFSKADIRVPQSQQTRFIHLEGEFRSSGTYSALPGETLQQLIARAGGLSPDAYLYGSEFTRESTRRVQQQRLNDYIDQISLQVGTNASNAAGRNISALDAAAAAASQSQNQSVLASLRQARASGRIVLDLQPDSKSLGQVPPLALEDGDSFIIPSIPATVSVTGAVYNPNSFLYAPNLKVGKYLSLAGGPNRNADSKRAYIVRADGSVISKQTVSSRHRASFNSLRMYPGDTLIVPLNLDKGAGLRTVVDIAQILGQFGLAIAAASVVF